MGVSGSVAGYLTVVTPGATASAELRGFRRWRARIRARPTLRWVWKGAVLLLGLAFVAVALALSVFPGPLTIPPLLLGVWIWSTEFRWAARLVDEARRRAKKTWEQARRRPVLATVTTLGGLAAAVAMVWVVRHYELVMRARDYLGV